MSLRNIRVSTFSPVGSDFNKPSVADQNIVGFFICFFNETPLNSDDQGPLPELVLAAALIMYSVSSDKLVIVYDVIFIFLCI